MIKIEGFLPQLLRTLKEGGQIRPTVYMETMRGEDYRGIYPMFHFIGDARTKASIMFNQGRSAGRENKTDEIFEIMFVTEAWMTKGTNPNPGQRPPAHVEQKECVMFHRVSGIPPFTQTASYYEIKRFKSGPKKGKAEELVLFMADQPVQGLLVQAFIAGWRSRDMTDEEVRVQQPQGISSFLR